MSSHYNLHCAYLLHARIYRETSMLLEMFTRDHGILSLIAKGARQSRSRLKHILVPFRQLQVAWVGKSDLLTLVQAEESGEQYPALNGTTAYCGFYLNELLIRLLHKHDPHVSLFNDYELALNELSAGAPIEKTLRLFEKRLLEHIGYGLNLHYDGLSGAPVQSGTLYYYDVENGLIPGTGHAKAGLISGKTLLAFANDDLQDSESMKECKSLMRHVLNHYLGNKPLKSRELLVNHF